MANSNTTLAVAKLAKEDEFYTQLPDIENEMKHYRKHFKDKTILCNCDDPFESNFFKYFVLNFNRLRLKKLIATCYTNSPIAGTQLTFEDIGKEFIGADRAYKAIVTEVYDATGNGGVDMLDVAELFKLGKNTIEELEGDGDFRSAECLELLDEADIIVTNPPFSLFREYIQTLLDRKKKFIVIGNFNAITYKEIFPHIKNNEMWLGYGFNAGNAFFQVPKNVDTSRFAKGVYDPQTGLVKFRNCCWFTNLDIKKRHEEIVLIKRYEPENYPMYANFDGIDVRRVVDIPSDYAGFMGVPITFLDKFNPDQFELIGESGILGIKTEEIKRYDPRGGVGFYLKNSDGTFKRVFKRIVIRNKNPEQPKA